jgi:hypothetical protein
MQEKLQVERYEWYGVEVLMIGDITTSRLHKQNCCPFLESSIAQVSTKVSGGLFPLTELEIALEPYGGPSIQGLNSHHLRLKKS